MDAKRSWAVLLVTWGCSGEVTVAPGGPAGVLPGPEPGPEPACEPELGGLVELARPRSGSFVDGTLHLEAEVDGELRYVVLELDAHGAHVAALPELDGPARLVAIRPGLHARVASGSTTVDVIDTTDPRAPVLTASIPLAGEHEPAWSSVYAAQDEHLLLCMRDADGEVEQRYLHAVDLADPAAPSIHGAAGNLCDGGSHHAAAANGAVWIVWGEEADVEVYLASGEGAVRVGDYFYAPDGVHQYGAVRYAASDGEYAVADPGSENEFFLFRLPAGGGAAELAHAHLGLAGPKRLLDVRGGRIYLASPDGVHAYTIDGMADPADLDYAEVSLVAGHAEIALGAALAEPIAATDERLVIADGAGAVYVVPRDHAGPLPPLEVRDRAPTGCP